jgi:hypothetical protein
MSKRGFWAAVVASVVYYGSVITLAAAGELTDQARQPDPGAQTLSSPARKNPFGRLFQPRELAPQRAAHPTTQPRAAREPIIVCGMRVIPSDPTVDPRIRLSTPEPKTKPAIRALEPPCYKNAR